MGCNSDGSSNLISHALLSRAQTLENIQTVYSHPQALAQCQVVGAVPTVQLIPANSTTEALQQLEQDWTVGAILSCVPTLQFASTS